MKENNDQSKDGLSPLPIELAYPSRNEKLKSEIQNINRRLRQVGFFRSIFSNKNMVERLAKMYRGAGYHVELNRDKKETFYKYNLLIQKGNKRIS